METLCRKRLSAFFDSLRKGSTPKTGMLPFRALSCGPLYAVKQICRYPDAAVKNLTAVSTTRSIPPGI